MKYLSLVVGILFMLVYTSCEQDKCKDRAVVCLNKGVCFDGVCNCPEGFEGDSCQFPVNAKFIGKFGGYRVFPPSSVFVQAKPDTFLVFKDGTDNFKVLLYSVFNPLIQLKGVVKKNEIKIGNNLPTEDGYTYTGSGSLNGSLLTLTVKADSLYLGVPQATKEYTFSGGRTK
jgi:hypothetical protein